MFAVRVTSDRLFERIAAEAHSPALLENAAALAACNIPVTRLGELVAAPINNSIRDVTGALDVDGAHIPMYRPADMDGGWLNYDSAPKLNAAFEARHAKSRV